ncbi:MAG: hypothetical protein GXO87_04915 [Chlorobi bacterium]|nr:hypothetical protein [Chlorobiota bacterium]
MLNHEIKIHDRKQFELKLHYEFKRKRRKGEYFVETYFFIPNTLGINKLTFHKKNFYDSVKNYIRFATPKFSFEELILEDNSPLLKAFAIASENKTDRSDRFFENFEHEVKMFCAIFAASIRKNAFDVVKIEPRNFEFAANNFAKLSAKTIDKFRELEKLVKKDERIYEIFQFGDEYVSLVYEKYLFFVLDEYHKKFSHENSEFQMKFLSFVKEEVDRRKEKKYTSIVRDDSSNEEMLFRFNTLKKYFSSVLSLETDVEKEGTVLEQILFSIAAGMAMLFATAAAFWGRSAFGTFTMPFFVLLVVSYMFKDRIKELLREILKKSVFKHLFDYKYKLFIDEKYKVGIIRESFDFIKMKKLDKEIFDMRQQFKTQEFDNKFQKEKVILYRKKINLRSKFLKKHGGEGLHAITDIFRFDITRLLSKMDDPRKPLYVLTKKGYKRISGKRVYHVNLILRIVRNKEVQLKRFRLVLTRKGIDRIEPIFDETIMGKI